MKKTKIFFMLLLVIFLTGCSGTYNLKINKDLTISENLEITYPNENNSYENTLKLFEDNKIDSKKYNVSLTDKNVKLVYNEEYESIEDYILNSYLYKQLFDDIDYKRENHEIKFNTTDVFDLEETSNNVMNKEDFSLLQINVTTPLKVIKNNADQLNDNTMSWTLNKNTSKKNILFILSADNINPRRFIFVLSFTIIVFGIIVIYFIGRFLKSHTL